MDVLVFLGYSLNEAVIVILLYIHDKGKRPVTSRPVHIGHQHNVANDNIPPGSILFLSCLKGWEVLLDPPSPGTGFVTTACESIFHPS